jgi:hypothetical protein
MSIPGGANLLLLASAAETAAAGVATKSLRFNNADSANLSKTFSSAGNRKTWTWAGWVKRSTLGTGKYGLFGGSGTNSMIRFNNDNGGDQLRVLDSATGGYDLITDRKFRDVSSWYHIAVAVDTTQSTAADRVKIYVNGVEETSFASSSYPTQNAELTFNNNISHTVGTAIGSIAFDGYLADVFFIDGLAVSPVDNFIELDDNGVYQARAYAGTFGTNGFHLSFSDATSTTTIAEDSSGNNNDFTANNISVTAGSGNDSLFDVPTNGSQSDTGAGGEVSGNYATLNPLTQSSQGTIENGNLEFRSTSSQWGGSSSTIGMESGKFYMEVNGGSKVMVGITSDPIAPSDGGYHSRSDSYTFYSFNGNKVNTDAQTSYSSAWSSSSDVVGAVYDADNGTLSFYRNGVSQGDAFTGLDTSKTWHFVAYTKDSTAVPCNFGQRAFTYQNAGTNRPAATFKALCTTNLSTPTIADGSDYFDVDLYSGTGASHTRSGFSFSPDLVWIKVRDAGSSHRLFDTVRGAGKHLLSNGTSAEETHLTSLSGFTSDGFTLGANAEGSTNVNQSSSTYVAWCWDAGSSTVSNTDGSLTSSVSANQTAGFSIVSYTSDSSATKTVGHGLGSAPKMILFKSRDNATNWFVHHNDGSTGRMFEGLNTTNSGGTNLAAMNNTLPSSSVFSLNSGGYAINPSGNKKQIAYCFAPVEGYSAIGSYEGNSASGYPDADGPFVYTGMRPAFIMLKDADASENWVIYDTARSTFNVLDDQLYPNASTAETSGANREIDVYSNGFKIRSNGGFVNSSGNTYIYYAVAENPFQANGGLAR